MLEMNEINDLKQNPCDSITLWNVESCEDIKFDNLKIIVTNLVHQLGVPPHIKGYYYLIEAIIIAVNDINSITAMSKVIYSSIAKTYNTSVRGVECAIRHAIKIAWSKSNLASQKRFFDYSSSKYKPTNAEFIATIAVYLHLHCD